jgi:hypothetical protein
VKRRCFLALFGVVGARKASSQQVPGVTQEFLNKIFAFSDRWEEFKRKLAGCELKTQILSMDDCNINKGILDYKSFKAAGKAAHKLWPPEEK